MNRMPDPRDIPGSTGNTEEYDEIDRLFLTRLDRAPAPEDLTAKILARTVAGSESTRVVVAWPWIVAGLVALGVLMVAGYQLGVSLAASDGLEIVGALVEDVGLFAIAPGDVFAALGEVIPWGMVALAGVSAASLMLAVGHVVSRVPTQLQGRRSAWLT
jgi:hypothetical protein